MRVAARWGLALKGTWESDRDPLNALRRGDASLFEAFVRAETTSLVGFFRRLGAERGEAEDLTQEVFVKLFQSADSYQPQGAFAPFALRVARNAWVDRRRRKAARPVARSLAEPLSPRERVQPALVTNELDAATRMSLREEASRLREAIAELSPAHAIVFELAVVQGLPYADVASAVGVPVGTVKSRVFNAVRRLREALGEEPRVHGEEGVA